MSTPAFHDIQRNRQLLKTGIAAFRCSTIISVIP